MLKLSASGAVALCAAAFFAGAPAGAAELITADGDVKIDRGRGFEQGRVGQELKTGDRVMVGPNSFARISYGTNCIERVRMHRMIVVQPLAPCGLSGWETVAIGEVQGLGAIAGTTTLAVATGVVAVTGVIAGVARTGRPASP